MTTSSGDSMSEHPELREALHTFMAQFMERTYHTTVLYDFGGPLADALLAPAGPVGKLQAELEALRERKFLDRLVIERCQQLEQQLSKANMEIDRLGEYIDRCPYPSDVEDLADPERIRREAIGASILEFIARHPLLRTSFWPVNAALTAGESAVTGEAT